MIVLMSIRKSIESNVSPPLCQPFLPPPQDETGGVVIDVGTDNARFGFAGDEMPKSTFNSVRTKNGTR